MRSDDVSLKRLSVTPLKRAKPNRFNGSTLQRLNAFALYEVLLGITIFALGVIALGHAVENCLNASTINAEEGVVRQRITVVAHGLKRALDERTTFARLDRELLHVG